MHWADIQAAIYKAGSSSRAIAQQEGVSPSLVSEVIRGNTTSHPVAYAIAAITSIPTERMWPGRYLSTGAYKKASQARGGNYGRFKGEIA